MSGNARGKSNPNAVSEADQDEGPTLSQIMAQLKVILAEQSVMKTFLSVCSGKMDEMQKQLKKQEDLVKDCTRKIQTVTAVVETLGDPDIQDYYWKEYTQEIPEEALPGGTDLQGNVTYIGQTIVDQDRVLPGHLDPTRQMLFYANEESSKATRRNIKVLCVHTPEAYEWVRTNIMAIRFRNSLNQRHLVVGGHYCQHPYFIGRAECRGQIVVGKLYYENFACATERTCCYKSVDFEVLVYNSRTPAKVTINKKCNPLGSDGRGWSTH